MWELCWDNVFDEFIYFFSSLFLMNQKHRKTVFLIAAMLFPPLFLLFIQHFLQPNYFLASSYKIIFLLPLVWRYFFHKKSWKEALTEGFSWQNYKKYFSHALGWGFLFSIIYFSAFFVFQNMIPAELIVQKLQSAAAITATNIVFIGLYIILINSLLEEFFWRGFFFKEMHALHGWLFAYLMTGIGFSLYHVAYFWQWFTYSGIFAIAVAGLFFYSLFMCMLFQKYQDLFTCWIIHALVDIVQIGIALVLFEII